MSGNELHRSKQVDIAKGLGILTVVLGHNNWLVLDTKGELFNLIYSFHMPLFFFLSGVFFKADMPLRHLAMKRADALLKPYFVTLTCLGLAYYAAKDIDAAHYALGVLYGNGRTIPWAALWFLTHLFTISVSAWFVIRLLAQASIGTAGRLLTLALMLVTGITFIDTFWEVPIEILGKHIEMPGLPFSIDLLLVTAPYFLLGHYARGWVMRFSPDPWLLLACTLIFFTMHWFFDATIDFNLRAYNGYLIPTIEALAGIYLTLSLANLLQRLPVAADALATAGQASLIILIFHLPVQGKAFLLASTLFEQHKLFAAVLAFVAGSIIPIFLWLLIKRSRILSYLYFPSRGQILGNASKEAG